MMASRSSPELRTAEDKCVARGSTAFSKRFRHADDAVHRRADFVAHVREKIALRAARGSAASFACCKGFVRRTFVMALPPDARVMINSTSSGALARLHAERVKAHQRSAFRQQRNARASLQAKVRQHRVGRERIVADVAHDHRLAVVDDPARGAFSDRTRFAVVRGSCFGTVVELTVNVSLSASHKMMLAPPVAGRSSVTTCTTRSSTACNSCC